MPVVRTFPVDDPRRLPPPAIDALPGRLVVSRSDCSVATLEPATGAMATVNGPGACTLRGSTLRAADGRFARVARAGSHLDATLYRRNGRRVATISRCNDGVRLARVALSVDAKVLIVETTDGGVTITTFAGRRLEGRIGPELMLSATTSPDGRWVAAVTDDGIAFLDATTLAPRGFTPVVARDLRWDAA